MVSRKPLSYGLYSAAEVREFANDWSEFDSAIAVEGPRPTSFKPSAASESYFHSYSYIGIHEEMLKDAVRTGTYHRAITQNRHLFEDKVVLDLGCGTGILSLFCVAAGARHVYAIECSTIIHLAKRLAEQNGASDKVTFLHGKCEDLELPVPSVDIIVSEWMGYFLLYENMLESVLFCRDKWLKPGGLIFPDRARLYMCAIEDAEYKCDKLDSWRDVYGFDFSPIRPYLLEEPLVDVVDNKTMNTTDCCVLDLDLHTCTLADLDFHSEFMIIVQRKDYIHALCFWFDVTFSACHMPLTLTTSPREQYTHWKQTVFYLPDDLIVDCGDKIKGMIAVRRNADNPRDLDVKLHYHHMGMNHSVENSHFYRIR
ncbi:Protein arginine N-methyltransferase 1 [Babesia sp. Xinjiang]|uniref:Protein arginine N-methyltransferase 1 n=1 Tax=Babesia sp. Xinjiang TaxID=462227 RepID=UPI000A23216E|nr:Protein arginine N-methyltransferase 1 [Babesia sp. Xinjiang]ORM41786.1 Protein arginine N-methyltransferase 1 [Babesia sp. Xinjiang]